MTGIICVNKEKDITSFGVVAKMRGITKEKKCGHTGTLDPMATGVLPVMLGGATRFLDFLPESDKAYQAEMIFGKTTDTLDITGKILSETVSSVTKDELQGVLLQYVGKIEQLPPMYSAVSVGGKRLYDLARQGIEVQREVRQVEIKKLNLVSFDEKQQKAVIDVLCTKGTYVRTLIDDVGKTLGCGATMSALVRTNAMGFELKDSLLLCELQHLKDSNQGFDKVLIPVEKLFDCYSSVTVTAAQAKRFFNGGALDADRVQFDIANKTLYKVYSPDGTFLGLGKGDMQKNELAVARLLINR